MPSTGGFKDFTGSIQSIVTAAAVIVGGLWAYFKFVRGRTFRPRLSVALDGEWRQFDGADALHVRVKVTNIGAAMVALNQFGSGLEVGFPAGEYHREVTWEKVMLEESTQEATEVAAEDGAVAETAAHGEKQCPNPRQFSMLIEHAWIEPGETVSDELLLNLGRPPSICMLELKLMWALSDKYHGDYSDSDIEVFTRRILAPDEKILDRLK